jgi:type VI secretion system secreted protein Hcp
MKYGDIDGQVEIQGFEKWIELESLSFGVSRGLRAGAGAGGASREGTHAEVSDIAISKAFDAASSKLFQYSVGNAKAAKVDIKFTSLSNNKVETYLEVELQDTLISSFQTGGAGGAHGNVPTESLSLNFLKITFTPSPIDKTGAPQKGPVVNFDVLTHKAS